MSINICPRCRRAHDPADVQRIARFDSGRPIAYRAVPLGGKAFPSREAAWDAICAHYQQETKND